MTTFTLTRVERVTVESVTLDGAPTTTTITNISGTAGAASPPNPGAPYVNLRLEGDHPELIAGAAYTVTLAPAA